MLLKENAIRIEKYIPGDGKPRNMYIFQCLICTNEIKVKAKGRMKSATGLCVTCNNRRLLPSALAKRRLEPYKANYNNLVYSAKRRNITLNLTYNDFLNLILTKDCEYCLGKVKWKEYGSHSTNIDRKNNFIGYIKENCVICCAKCNRGKGNQYTYEEWYGMTKYFRDKVCGV